MYRENRVVGQKAEDWARGLGAEQSLLWFSWTSLRTRFSTPDPLWKKIRPFMRAGQRVLDAGCGMGQWVMFLNRQGLIADGLDFSKQMIQTLQRVWPRHQWMHGSVQAIPTAASQYDHVISWGVIEHDIDGPGRALDEFYRILKPGGHVIVTTPLDSRQTRRLSALEAPEQEDATFFQYFFTLTELSSYLTSSGFQVIKAVPASRHYAMIFPKFHLAMQHRGRIAQGLITRSLAPIISTLPETHCMGLAIGQKPYV
jgi:ubiquinone/menaquinone biosynthesis C-methylase UbiE